MLHTTTCNDCNLINSFDSNSSPQNPYVIIDSGASVTYLPKSHSQYISPQTNPHRPISVSVANGNKIKSIKSGKLSVGPITIENAHIFPELQNPLLSVRNLCDQNLKVVFEKHKVSIYTPNDDLLSTSPRTSEFWTLPLSQPHDNLVAFNAYPVEPTNAAQCLFWQRSLFSPCKSTMISAAANIGLPRIIPILTAAFIRKNYVYTNGSPQPNKEISTINETCTY
jgi:hypothetical protein